MTSPEHYATAVGILAVTMIVASVVAVVLHLKLLTMRDQLETTEAQLDRLNDRLDQDRERLRQAVDRAKAVETRANEALTALAESESNAIGWKNAAHAIDKEREAAAVRAREAEALARELERSRQHAEQRAREAEARAERIAGDLAEATRPRPCGCPAFLESLASQLEGAADGIRDQIERSQGCQQGRPAPPFDGFRPIHFTWEAATCNHQPGCCRA